MLLVKSDEELDLLEKTTDAGTGKEGETKGLMRVLEHCGVPRSWGEWEEPQEGAMAEPIVEKL